MRKDVFLGLAVAIVLILSVSAYTFFFNKPTQKNTQTYKPDNSQKEPARKEEPQKIFRGSEGFGSGLGGIAVEPPTRPSPTTHEASRETARRLTDPWEVLLDGSNNSGARRIAPENASNTRPGTPYVVKQGDTLWGIAVSSYGNGAYASRISAANPGINPSNLKPGTTLKIPEKSTVITEAGATVPVITNINPQTQYRVATGDNLNTIARNLYGSSGVIAKAKELFEANKDILSNPDSLKPGMVLKLPTPPSNVRTAPSSPSPTAISSIER